jgi:hypothetical protein
MSCVIVDGIECASVYRNDILLAAAALRPEQVYVEGNQEMISKQSMDKDLAKLQL